MLIAGPGQDCRIANLYLASHRTRYDAAFTPESRAWAARNVFGIEPIEIEGGHFPMLERPSQLADILVANLERSDGPIGVTVRGPGPIEDRW